jgi:hypothetical protein
MKQDKETQMDPRRSWWANRWFLPGFSLLLGGAMWVAFWAGGAAIQGAYSFGVMAILGAVILFGGRSDTIRGLRGDGRDERWAMIDQKATAFAGLVLITAVIVGFIVEIANGRDGSPYGQLGALSGLAYIAAILIGRWKS